MLVLAAAVALRLRGLRSFGLWQDELISWEMTSNGLHHYLDVFRHVDANQPLHVIALLAWGTKGKSEAWIRLPSVVEGIAAVAATMALGRRVAGLRAAIVAGALVAIAPAMIRYSQDARGYALVALLVVLSTHALLRAVDPMIPGSQTGRWLIYVLSAVAVVAAHQLALVAIASQALGLMLARYPIRRWLPAFGAVGLGSMPLLFAIRTQTGNTSWIPALSRERVRGSLTEILAPPPVIALLIIVIVYLASRGGWRPDAPGTVLRERIERRVIACVAIVPWLAIIAVSAFRPLLVPRYLLFTIPFWAIALATAGVEAAASNDRRLIGAAGVGALASIWLAPIVSLPSSAERGLLDQRPPLAEVAKAFRPGDRVIYSDLLARRLASYYVHPDDASWNLGMTTLFPPADPRFTLDPARTAGPTGPVPPGASVWAIAEPDKLEHELLVASAAGYVADVSRPTSAYFQVVRLRAIDSRAAAS